MARQSLLRSGVLVLGLMLISAPGYAQRPDIGKQEYLNSCAVCHGTTGKGDGPLASELKTRPSDLTHIDKVSIFPVLYGIIDGRRIVAFHGPREMPVWGDRYLEKAAGSSGGYATPEEMEEFTRGRILALIGYISTLQAK